MNRSTARSEARSQAFFMFISALIFGYFGFSSDWSHQWTTDEPPVRLTMVVALMWALRIGAILFALSGVLAGLGSMIGLLLNCVTGLLTAAIFLVVAYWEWTNPKGYYSGIPAFLLVLFALWNGYGSYAGLMELRGIMCARPASPST